jgi:diadenosine tetraphosphate (Ap4A) HIT family hydrolase
LLRQSGAGKTHNVRMDNPQPAKVAMDTKDYAVRVQRIRQEGRCFICRVIDRTHSYSHHVVYEDADTIVFLNRYPTLVGYCLVSPRKHVEDWARDLSEAEFLTFQRVVHRVAGAIAATVPTERVYSLSIGSQQANAHVHWHVAPLPPGVPYEHQEFNALLKENGILDISEADQAELARTIRSHL